MFVTPFSSAARRPSASMLASGSKPTARSNRCARRMVSTPGPQPASSTAGRSRRDPSSALGGLRVRVNTLGDRTDSGQQSRGRWSGRTAPHEYTREPSTPFVRQARCEPNPDPAKAGEVGLRFEEGPRGTKIEFEHRGFSRHGEGGEGYREALGSERGWPYILDRYAAKPAFGRNGATAGRPGRGTAPAAGRRDADVRGRRTPRRG